jgi:putative N6-adenine-specific DNA methylase
MTRLPPCAPPYGYAVCAPGLETLLQRELKEQGLTAYCAQGGVVFVPPIDTSLETAIAKANLHCRTASRILLVVYQGKAKSFAQLQKCAGRVDWTSYLTEKCAIQFSATSKKSRLYHTKAIIERLRAIVPGGDLDADETNMSHGSTTVFARLQHDHLTLSLDSSGGLLHRRGYRTATSRAPLRETLAASALLSSGWNASTPLLDPMCGSGTFLIEGAFLALGIAPGAKRRFAMESWTKSWATSMQCARDRLPLGVGSKVEGLEIVGIDRDFNACEAAKKNAQRAGVEVLVVHADAEDATPTPGPEGLIICNPPYGQRIKGHKAALASLCRLQTRFKGWKLGVICPNSPGPGFRSIWMASNGGIRVKFWLREPKPQV